MGEKARKNIAGLVIKYIVIVIVVALGYQSFKLVKVSNILDGQIKATEKEIHVENEKLEILKEEYENINSLENIEKLARENLGLVKEDEIVFRSKDNKN